MKFKVVIISLAVVFIASLSTAALFANTLGISIFSSSDNQYGKRFKFIVSDKLLNSAPSWPVNEEFPPISPRRAVKSARSLLEKLVSDPQRWQRDRITLEEITRDDKWIYTVEFYGPDPRVPGGGSRNYRNLKIVVLMNGEVVVPEISEWPEKKDDE